MNHTYQEREAGFTIIEILAVLTLIAFILLMVAPNIMRNLQQGKITATKAQISATENVLNNYYMDNGNYPSTEQGLRALIEKPSGVPPSENWNGPYLMRKVIPSDAWGRELHYQCPAEHNTDTFDLSSYGQDNAAGGSDANADLGNC